MNASPARQNRPLANLYELRARLHREGCRYWNRFGWLAANTWEPSLVEFQIIYMEASYYQRLRQRLGLRPSRAQAERLTQAAVERHFGRSPYALILRGKLRARPGGAKR
jgi:hypothetical protein